MKILLICRQEHTVVADKLCEIGQRKISWSEIWELWSPNFQKLHALSTSLNFILISIKKLSSSFPEQFLIIFEPHLMETTTDYWHRRLPCMWTERFGEPSCLASKTTAINTTIHATLDYMIPRVLQYVDDTCYMVDSGHPRLIISSKSVLLTIITNWSNESMLGSILANFHHGMCLWLIANKKLTRVPPSCFI